MSSEQKILPNEKELFTRISQGDEAAFTEVFYYYEPRIFPFIFKITNSRALAQEIVQELFLTLWLRRETIVAIEHPRSYIFRMAANKTATWLKKEARKTFVEKDAAEQITDKHNNAEETIVLREMQEIINRAVEQLPRQQKLVYRLNRQQGLKKEEIAQQLNISEKTVKNHLTKALRSIRHHLENYPGISITLLMIVTKLHQ